MGKPRQLKLLGDQLVAVDETQTARVERHRPSPRGANYLVLTDIHCMPRQIAEILDHRAADLAVRPRIDTHPHIHRHVAIAGIASRRARRALNKDVSGLVARRGARARDSVCGRTCSRFWREGPRLDVDRRPGLARWRAGLRPGRRRWPGIQAVWGVSVQTPAVRVRPRPMRLRRLSPAVRRVSHAWFLTVPR